MNRSGTQRRDLGERLLLVLAGAGRALSLREMARAIGVYDSSARYALARLGERGLVERSDASYSLAVAGEVLDFELRHATRKLGTAEALRLLAVLNAAISFLSLSPSGRSAEALLSEAVEPRDVLRLRDLAKRHLELEIGDHQHRELLGTTVERQAALEKLRRQLAEGDLVKGDLARLPRPGVRGDFAHARPQHRPHSSLPKLSRRTLQRLARRYGLAALSLFGSAVRADFRPDSDVDVLVRYRPGVRRTLRSMSDLREELSTLLGRAVDLVDEKTIYPELRANIARDVVRLYGRSRADALASGAGEEARAGRDRGARAPR